MDKFSLMVPNFIPAGEYFDTKKNNTCVGCGVSLAVRHVGKAVKELLGKATCERASAERMFGIKSEAAFLKIKKGKKEVLFFLDDEPSGKLDDALDKKLPGIAIAEGFQYVATASPSYPFDLFDKAQRAIESEGNAFVHILCPCPAGWQFSTEDTVKVGFRAVETLAFPLYEAAGGFYNLTIKTLKPRALEEYIAGQGRFSGLSAQQIKTAQAQVDKSYARLTETLESQMTYSYETTGPVY